MSKSRYHLVAMELLMHSTLKRGIVIVLGKQGLAVIFGGASEPAARKHVAYN